MRSYRLQILVILLLSAVLSSELHGWLRDRLIDTRTGWISRAATGAITIVEIDARSISAVGQWPWPRGVHARLIEALDAASVSGIVFDVDFSARSTPAEDAKLEAALKAAGGSVVLPAFRQRSSDGGDPVSTHINRPIASLAQHAWLGLVNVVPDDDGLIRRYTPGARLDGEFVPSIAALMAGRHDESLPPFRIDFGIRAETLPSVSAIGILNGEPAALATVKGKTIVIGGTAVELGDRFTIPGGRVIPGVTIQALAAESLVQKRAMTVTSFAVSLGLAALPLILMGLMRQQVRLSRRILVMAGAGVLVEATAICVQALTPIAVDTSLVLAAALACILAMAVDELDWRGLVAAVAERRFRRIAMSLGDGLVCLDDAGTISLWNRGAETIFGYSGAQVIGQRFDMLLAGVAAAPGSAFLQASSELALLPRNGVYLVELVGLRETGESFDLECSFSSWAAPDGIQYGVVLRDISVRKRQEEQLRYLAECEPVTGVANRHSLLQALARQLSRGAPATLILIGIGRYRQIMTMHGASFADAFASVFARELAAAAGTALVIARLDGDEFALLVEDEETEASELAARLIRGFEQTVIRVGDRLQRTTLNVGIAGHEGAQGAETWLGNGQFALSAARVAASSLPVPFQASMRDTLAKRDALEIELGKALAQDQFELFFQPQLDLRTNRIVGAEALIRWRHPSRGYVSPGEFMPVVNTSSLSDGVAAWVLRTAIEQAARWQSLEHPVRVGINLSQSQFAGGRLVADVRQLITQNTVDPALIELEVTEDIILESAAITRQTLTELRDLGVKIAFDDFGTGYGSLTYLKAFPLDTIKIDQSFVRALDAGGDDAAIVSSTIALGHALGLSVIAEGIETAEVSDWLRNAGCDEGQGYFYGRPIDAGAFEELLKCPAAWVAAA